MRIRSILIAVVALRFAVACVASAPLPDNPGSASADQTAASATKNATKTPPATTGAQPVANASEAIAETPPADTTPSPPVDVDGGADTTQRPNKASMSIDGKACTVDLTATGIDFGFPNDGWSLSVYADCSSGEAIFTLDGVGTSYPQTAKNPYYSEEAAMLFTGEGDDAGVGATYRVALPGGGVAITSGPIASKRAPVVATATVVDQDNPSKKHAVSISIDF